MENSVLSDASGIQKNISVMYEEYAKKIGKSTDALTQAEKVQAVYNGYMDEAKDFIGTASEMANSYQGQQAQLNATNLELSRTVGQSMIPALTQYSSLQLNITKNLAEFISNHKSATSGVITFTTTVLAMIVALTAAKKAYTAYKTAAAAADMTTKAFTISLMTNPITLIAVGIAAVTAGISIYSTKMQEAIDKMDEATEKSKTLSEALQNTINNNMIMTKNDKQTIVDAKEEANEIIQVYEEKQNKIKEIEGKINEIKKSNKYDFQKNGEINALTVQLNEAQKALSDFEKENFTGGKSIDTYRKKVETLTKGLEINEAKQKYATATNQAAHRQTLINIAQTKADIQGKQQLLDILKEGKTSTEAYTNAKTQLVKVYPELAKVNENTIASTQSAIDAENAAADAKWANAQVAIQASILEVSAMMSNSEQIKQIAAATKQSVEEVTASLQNQINILGNLAKLTPSDFKGSVTSSYTPKKSSSSSSTYKNKALDNYKKQIEYKKALEQIDLQQEIAMYQIALKKYAKTADERMELTQKIYELQKELQEKNLDDYTAMIEHRKNLDQISLQDEINMYQYAYNSLAKTTEQKQELEEKLYELRKELAQKNKDLLEQQTTDYERYIEDQKNLRGAEYDTKEQEEDLNKIILLHKNYLNQIMKDERLSLDERKELYQEELDTIRDYEKQKRDLRVQSVDDTVSKLTNAITKQLEELEEADKKAIESNIEAVEKWKKTRVNAINEEYNARIEAIQKELDLLDKSEEDKTRAEEDAEYERKKNRLQQLIEYEHDATTKANYQKELDKLVAEYQKTLDKRALADKKEALNAQKDLLKDEQDDKIQNIEDEAEKRKEQYEKQLDELEEYYDKQKELAQETAEKMLLNVDQNQNKILELLKSYGDAYEITGQSLGEKLAQGINNGIADKIQNVIQKIQDTIDAGIENKIKEWTSGMYKYEAGANNPKTQTINVYQTNNIEQNPEMPSETYRKLRNIDEQLASSLAGM
nr:MAG TPA: chromosome segregation protein [Caudoviricetes sp.]